MALAQFALESVVGTATPVSPRVRRASLITTAVLAVDAALLVHARRQSARRKAHQEGQPKDLKCRPKQADVTPIPSISDGDLSVRE